MTQEDQMQFRDLPSVDSVMVADGLTDISTTYQRELVVNLVRLELKQARQQIQLGKTPPAASDIANIVRNAIESMTIVTPMPTINATGVIIHTNMGRAPLSQAATDAITGAAHGYSNLELDLATGRRGSRQAHVQSLLQQLTGAEAAMVVNNNASGVLLGFTALAKGKQVIVSRGEAVEIGGGFRIPDVLLQSGATLNEVGTTNRTYKWDYEDAINESAAAILKTHTSNFRVEGYAKSVNIEDLAELGRKQGIPVLHDVGSGCLLNTEKYGLVHEPTPQESIAAGADLIFFSGDKLLGGPQAGIIIGRLELIQRLQKHPLARAIRIDKLSLAGLSATLIHYLHQEAEEKVPLWRMIATPPKELRRRAKRWQSQLQVTTSVEPCQSTIGGGSLPGETLPSWALTLSSPAMPDGPDQLLRRLRNSKPPVVARIEDNRVLLDPRTVLPQDDKILLKIIMAATQLK
jgi:L-seryl-tRNA(Ser) seleniumtransferase